MATNRVKLFSGAGAPGVESKVNAWFDEMGASVEVQSVTTAVVEDRSPNSVAPGKIIVTILYSETSK